VSEALRALLHRPGLAARRNLKRELRVKLRSLFLALSSSLLFSGCPTNTYPAGEKDAYPLTDYQVFYDAAGAGKSEHDKAETIRNQLANPDTKPDQLGGLRDQLREQSKKEKDEQDGIDKLRPIVRRVLAKLFGSPEHPSSPIVANSIDIGPCFDPHGDDSAEEPGSGLDTGRKLYKQHCMHCHGFYGMGDGPTANFLLPKPRDFHYGKVKFTSTKGGMRPVHDDLVRTIAQGIQGTMMPAFGPAEGIPRIGIFAGHAGPAGFDVDAVATYVEVLLMRGAVEAQLAAKWADDGDITKDSAQDAVNVVLQQFKDAAAAVVMAETPRPADFEASAAKGAKLFGYHAANVDELKAAKAGCAACHGTNGLGMDSAPAEIGAKSSEDAQKTLLQPNDFKLPSMPMNLTFGVYRGGRRPIDLYRRFDAGIKGTPMPGQHGNLTSEEIWNVVDFVYKLGLPKPVE
jgi:mono/diheme cytochrome c family protein